MKQVECYGLPSDFQLAHLGSPEPRVLNGEVSVTRYRITVEEIIEPVEVLRDRLVDLQKQRLHTDNYKAIRNEAKRLGVELPQQQKEDSSHA